MRWKQLETAAGQCGLGIVSAARTGDSRLRAAACSMVACRINTQRGARGEHTPRVRLRGALLGGRRRLDEATRPAHWHARTLASLKRSHRRRLRKPVPLWVQAA